LSWQLLWLFSSFLPFQASSDGVPWQKQSAKLAITGVAAAQKATKNSKRNSITNYKHNCKREQRPRTQHRTSHKQPTRSRSIFTATAPTINAASSGTQHVHEFPRFCLSMGHAQLNLTFQDLNPK
jgi:hypothetical protein